jgi:hypothetical protein
MASLDKLPDEILLKIFSYLSTDDLVLSARNVCTRWRAVSEDDEMWFSLTYCPNTNDSREQIIFMLENMPALRQFRYIGTSNVIEKLCECCRRVGVLHIACTTLNVTHLQLVMERLTELRDLGILMSPTKEGLQINRIIG